MVAMQVSFYAGRLPTFTKMSAAPPLRPPVVSLRRERVYLRVRTRFLLSVFAGLVWSTFSFWLSLPWIAELARSITLPGAIVVVFGIAIVPGYLNFQLAAALLLDRPPALRLEGPFPPVAILIAAYNEAERLQETLTYALRQDYPGGLEVLVLGDRSTDGTAEIVRGRAARDRRIRLLQLPHGGKAIALNAGLEAATAALVATI